MGWNTPDVYYQPEKFDLVIVAEIEYGSGSYEFDTRVVWKDPKGKLYTARDAGCSCYSPFENFTELSDLEDFDLVSLEDEVKSDRHGYSAATDTDVADFLRKIRDAAAG